jgi:hypothetical protein
LSPEHSLFGIEATALAVAPDRDDVLFEVNLPGGTQFAVVHLTWSQKTAQAPWPGTTIFRSREEWIEWMRADHDDYVSGDL